MKKYLPIILILILAALLRLIALDKFPAGLNADEAAIGYNAWSLIQTGKDEHSNSWPLVFRSFDDYKPPVYFYLVLPFVKAFGLNIWSVRLPSALLGIASVYLIYLLVKQLFNPVIARVCTQTARDSFVTNLSRPEDSDVAIYKKSSSTFNLQYSIFSKIPVSLNIGHFAAFFLAISPWHLQFSRGGWEVNAALFFILLGIYGFFKGLENSKYLFLFVISFAISLYTYHSARLISPLLALSLVVIYWKQLSPSVIASEARQSHSTNLKTILSALILGLFMSLPLAGQLLSKEGQSRFTGVSVFSDSGPLWRALELRREHPSLNLYVKTIHNQYLSYGLRFAKNYLSHFSPRFLFVTGDEIARSKVPGMGQSYKLLVPFLFLGVLNLLKLDSKSKKFILFWFLISPIAAALTFQSPHALRSQNMVIPLTLISALGLSKLFEFTKTIKIKFLSPFIAIMIFLCGLYSLGEYLHQYYIHYPKELSYAWQYGFDQIAQYSKDNYDKYDKIIISDRYDQPYILMAFFLKYPPQTLQKELVMTPRDKFGFSTVRKFGKFEFRAINYNEDKNLANTLIIAADEAVDDKTVIHTIQDMGGKTLFKFIPTTSSSRGTK
jgi:hypothetical protein